MVCPNCNNTSPGDIFIYGLGFAAQSLLLIGKANQSFTNMAKAASVIVPLSMVIGFLAKKILTQLIDDQFSTLRKRTILILTPLISIPLSSLIAVKMGLAPSIGTGIMASYMALSILVTLSIIPLALDARRYSILNLAIDKIWVSA